MRAKRRSWPFIEPRQDPSRSAAERIVQSPDQAWSMEALERLRTVAAAGVETSDNVKALQAQVSQLRGRLDSLAAVAAQLACRTDIELKTIARPAAKLVNGDFILQSHDAFDYERVLNSIAVWNTGQESLAGGLRYDEWYRTFGRAVTIIIPSYNDHNVLSCCLASIRRVQDAYPSLRVIVADDASPSAAHQHFLQEIATDRVLVLPSRKNLGFARTVNRALSLVQDEDIILLNSDVIAEGFWLEALQYAAIASNSAIIGAKLLYPDRTIQHAGVHRNPAAPLWFDHYHRGKHEFFGPACVPEYALAVTGACMYITNAAYQRLGPLDPDYPMAFEDVDYCLRAWEAGERVLYYPYATLVHRESATRGRAQGPRELASQDHFWHKWSASLDRRVGVSGAHALEPDIVYVLEDTGIAGGHRNIFDQINLLIEDGWNVQLWATAGQPAWYDLRTKVRQFPSFWELGAELAKLDCIKVATWWNTAETVWLASRQNGVPAYLVSDIEASYYVNDAFMRAKVLASYKQDFRYFTICRWNQEKLAELGIDAAIVSCSVDREVFRPLDVPKRDGVLLSAGRRNHLKNFQFTLRSWMALGEERPFLWMYGTEPDISDFLDRTRYFVRPSDQYLNRLLNEATGFILTSRHEGFALTILEAMSAGTPVITTDCHGNRDFCRHEQNCLMVEDNDYLGLMVAIRRLMSEPDLRARLRRGGFATAERFSRDMMKQQLVAFFTSLTEKSAAPTAVRRSRRTKAAAVLQH